MGGQRVESPRDRKGRTRPLHGCLEDQQARGWEAIRGSRDDIPLGSRLNASKNTDAVGNAGKRALALGIASGPAAEFSFLLGIVAIAGAAVLILPEFSQATPEMMSHLAVACSAALVSGIVAIWLFVWLLRRRTFYVFAWYTWAAGLAFLIWLGRS